MLDEVLTIKEAAALLKLAEKTVHAMAPRDRRSAAVVFRKMLMIAPGDNHQGARCNLAAAEAGKTWEEMEGDA